MLNVIDVRQLHLTQVAQNFLKYFKQLKFDQVRIEKAKIKNQVRRVTRKTIEEQHLSC